MRNTRVKVPLCPLVCIHYSSLYFTFTFFTLTAAQTRGLCKIYCMCTSFYYGAILTNSISPLPPSPFQEVLNFLLILKSSWPSFAHFQKNNKHLQADIMLEKPLLKETLQSYMRFTMRYLTWKMFNLKVSAMVCFNDSWAWEAWELTLNLHDQ